MRSSRNTSFLSGLASLLSKRLIHTSGNVQTLRAGCTSHAKANPLLNISIGKRLALGFLIPALIAMLTLSSVSMQSQQRLSQEATFYQHLLTTYTSLTTASGNLEDMHTYLLQTITYAAQPHVLSIVLSDYRENIHASTIRYNKMLSTYLQQDLVEAIPTDSLKI